MLLLSELSIDAEPVALALAVLMFFVGASIGSFLNVVVYRVPAGMSIVSPASRCPRCSTPIHSRHNVPILGWLWLRGRCYTCREPISARYPLVELVTALMFLSLAWVEWPAGGENLPGLALTEHQRYGIFAYHVVLLLGLLTFALMEYDGHAAPKLGIVLSLTGVLAGAIWPMLHAISPPFTAMTEREMVAPAMMGFVDGLAGWVVGIVMGCLAAIVTDRGPSGLAGRNGALVSLASVGAFLGWQAVAPIAAISIGVFSLIVMYRAGWRRLRVVPFGGVLAIVTFAWLMAWRQIVDEFPSLGSRADHRTLIIAGSVVIVAGVMARTLVKQPAAPV